MGINDVMRLLIMGCLAVSGPAAAGPDDPGGPNDRWTARGDRRSTMRLVPHRDRVYMGLYSIGDVVNQYHEMTVKSGGLTPGIVLTFHDWNSAGIEADEPVLQTMRDPMEGEDTVTVLQMARRVWDDGGVLAVVWDPITYLSEHPGFDLASNEIEPPITFAQVLAGEFDAYIGRVAREVRSYGGPIMISPVGEFNVVGTLGYGPLGNEYLVTTTDGDRTGQYGDPMRPDGPERVRDLIRHVVDIFDRERAENVTWFMYSHSAYMNPEDLDDAERGLIDYMHPSQYYPGDSYIDWVGNSAYISNDDETLDLDFAVEHAIEAWASVAPDKPFFLTEFGITETGDDSRAGTIATVLALEIPRYPGVRAVTFADSPLFESLFDIPDLGAGEGEVRAWNAVLTEIGLYTTRVRLGR